MGMLDWNIVMTSTQKTCIVAACVQYKYYIIYVISKPYHEKHTGTQLNISLKYLNVHKLIQFVFLNSNCNNTVLLAVIVSLYETCPAVLQKF